MSIMNNEGHSPTGLGNTPRQSPIVWRPWKDAPRDGRWLVALCNDRVSLHRVSWGVDRKGVVGWCTADGSFGFGDGIFAPRGGWIGA